MSGIRTRRLLRHESEVWVRESADVRENERKVGCGDAKPRGESRIVFIDAGRWNPPTATSVVRTIQRKVRHPTINVSPFNGSAQDQVMGTPTVVGAITIGRPRPAEIGCGEGGDLVGDSKFVSRFGKGGEA